MNGPDGKAEISALIPHAGAMCLLDSVRFWDDRTIVCTASSHRDSAHPMGHDNRLHSVCGIEYGAQAMAVHNGLSTATLVGPAAGYLASVRNVVCHTGRLDLLRDDLEVTATRLSGDAAGAIYQFEIRCGGMTVMEGRAAVVLDATRTPE